MSTVPRTLRRLALAALAAASLGAVAQAAPASADLGSTGFGAGSLPGMEITEGGVLDYAVSLPPCPEGVECNLFMRTSSGKALKNADFTSSSVTPLKTYRGPGDGRMIGIHRISTVDDAVYEGDEPLWFEARVDYYPGGCPNGRPGSSPSCLPESSFRWLGVVTIDDNDSRFARVFVRDRALWRVVRGGSLTRLGAARTTMVSRTFSGPAAELNMTRSQTGTTVSGVAGR